MDEKKNTDEYTNGFNSGYLLSRFEPQVYKQVTTENKNDTPYMEGVIDGHRQHQRELFLQNCAKSREINKQIKPRLK